MKKVLFLIHDLGHGGAEKVLVNLVNNMDPSKFDISVIALFGGGVNERFLKPHIHYHSIFKKPIRGNSHVMKLFTPSQLHHLFIKEHYDIEISYLEGPSARIISGCTDSNTKLISWIHSEQKNPKKASHSFRSIREATICYNRFHMLVGVSESVKNDFMSLFPISKPMCVLYNTNESEQILSQANEAVESGIFSNNEIKLIGVGKLTPNKGFSRLINIHYRLRTQGYPVHTYILGVGPEEKPLRNQIKNYNIDDSFTLLGYQTNPYKYVSKCDLFVCASFAEGFSTAATEALIVGTPVCTVDVSGMREMLGADNEWGIITDNNEEALYLGIKSLLDEPALLSHYKAMAAQRGKFFNTQNTVRAVENMLDNL